LKCFGRKETPPATSHKMPRPVAGRSRRRRPRTRNPTLNRPSEPRLSRESS
jgi:hypothetical protein